MASVASEAPCSRVPAPAVCGHVQVITIEGFGEPWVVRCKAVWLWDKLDGGDVVQQAKMNSIVGAQAQVDRPDGTRILLSRTANEAYEAHIAVTSTEHHGHLMEALEGAQNLDACLIASPFREMYRDVVDICHQRIWEDNVDALWKGDRTRMPSRAATEAKLMRPSAKVLHATATSSGDFLGGAIVQSLRVPSLSVGTEVKRESTVVYLDCCATVPGSHAGQAIWRQIAKIPCTIVALHSIILEKTLAFWTACGLKRVDCSDPSHQKWFSKELYISTGGLLGISLTDLRMVLPHSTLPLHVYCVRGAQIPEEPVGIVAGAEGLPEDGRVDLGAEGRPDDGWCRLPTV